MYSCSKKDEHQRTCLPALVQQQVLERATKKSLEQADLEFQIFRNLGGHRNHGVVPKSLLCGTNVLNFDCDDE
jgi:hypothetical protein